MELAWAGFVACRRCGARTRTTGAPCKAPAMKGKARCRLHGGASPGAPKGEQNGNYRHGRRTQEAETQRRQGRALLRELLRLLAEPESRDDD
jgi:glucans biosynthesis protein